MFLLNVSGVTKLQAETFVLNNVSFAQYEGQKIAVAGETGSGKSTLLKIIAGLVQADAGEVSFAGMRVAGPDDKLIPGHKGIGYLSQQFELRSNYKIHEVLEYANLLPDKALENLYEICRIGHLLQRRTDQVSGGEQQRIAIAKTLTSSPRLLLLDEPYSNLDMIHKNILKAVIRDIGNFLKITCILISHDPADTLSWADEIIILKDGQIVQQAPPQQIYRQPANEYVAALFGKYNLINHVMSAAFNVSDTAFKDKRLFVRPENFIVSRESGTVRGVVKEIIFMGNSYESEVVISDNIITVKTTDCNYVKGDNIFISLSQEKWYL